MASTTEPGAGPARGEQDRDWFDALLAPRSVAVVGASDDLRRPGGRIVAALLRHGFQGRIHPVNPKRAEVQGLPCLQSARDAPGGLDVGLIVIPAAGVLQAVEDCAAAGARVAVVGSAGFSETGAAGAALQAELARRAAELGIRVVGPNTNGLVSCASRFAGTFTPALEEEGLVLREGPTAIVSQSGALGAALFVLAQRSGLASGTLVNTGNEIDVSFEEVLERIVAPGAAVLGYIEGISDAAALVRAIQAAEATGTPVGLLKVGDTPVGARAAEAHTAKLAGEGKVYDGVLAQLGVARARSLTELIDIGRIFAAYGGSVGRRLSIASLSGGAGIILSDLAHEAGLEVPAWDTSWQARLAEWLPDHLGKGNPIDLAGGPFFDLEKLERILHVMDSHPAGDASVLAVASFERLRDAICSTLERVAPALSKPLFVTWIGDPGHAERRLTAAGIPCFGEPRRCIDAVAAVAGRSPGSIVREAGTPVTIDAPAPGAGQRLLAADEGRRLLSAYELPLVEELIIDLDGAPEPPGGVPLPAVVKLTSPELAHKSDVGAVLTGLRTRDEVVEALARLRALGSRLGLGDGRLVVQRQVEPGLELLLGMKRDPVFGPVLTLGLGGVTAEALDDVVVRLPWLDHGDVADMLRALRHQRLIGGFRHLPALDAERIAPCVLAFAQLIRDHGDRLTAVDLNPVIVPPEGPPVIVDVLVAEG